VLSLIDVPRRFQVRAPVEISPAANHISEPAYCHTENLSMSGMLVSCMRPAPVGCLLDFALLFPEEERPIRGRARVARIADPRREKVLGGAPSELPAVRPLASAHRAVEIPVIPARRPTPSASDLFTGIRAQRRPPPGVALERSRRLSPVPWSDRLVAAHWREFR
jgi:hypothetical protein